jgi:putative nucleotidyltransferase with HDIG domain
METLEKILNRNEFLVICIRKSFYSTYNRLVSEARTSKIKTMQDKYGLDYIITKTYNSICQVSQAIISEGINIKTLKEVEDITNIIVINMANDKKTLPTLIKMVSFDPSLYDHSTMVSILNSLIASKTPVGNISLDQSIRIAAKSGLFHDIGKIGVDTVILNKPTKLTSEEFNAVKKHSEFGKEILVKANLPSILSIVAFQHHEKYDGTGYPLGKRGRYEADSQNGIHLYSRICTVSDVYSALIMKRVYKEAFSPEKTISIMTKDMTGTFDPKILKSFIEILLDSIKYEESEMNQAKINYKAFLEETRAKITG